MRLCLALLRDIVELLAYRKPARSGPYLRGEEKTPSERRIVDRLLLVLLRGVVLRGVRPVGTERDEIHESPLYLRIVADNALHLRESAALDDDVRRRVRKRDLRGRNRGNRKCCNTNLHVSSPFQLTPVLPTQTTGLTVFAAILPNSAHQGNIQWYRPEKSPSGGEVAATPRSATETKRENRGEHGEKRGHCPPKRHERLVAHGDGNHRRHP